MNGIAVRQTHVSWLIFTPERVYKVKRPVRFGFLDFTTPAARWQACRAEVELNRRLAPDVYEGVGEFIGPDGSIEPVVVMRRLPEDRPLSALVRADDPSLGGVLDEVASALAAFHRRSRRGPDIDASCGANALGALWRTNLEELQIAGADVIDGSCIAEAREAAASYLDGRGRLFDGRVAQGRAVDGHGDLMCDDTFLLPDGPRFLDCLEFDDRLRHIDVLADAAALAMDLEHLGRRDLATAFLSAYRLFSGDDWPGSLAHLYIAYRAGVRAKVHCLRASEASGQERDSQEKQARDLMDLSLRHLRDGAVRLTIVGGLPGSGKTTLAGQLAALTGWTVISSDVVRKRLAGLDPDTPTPSAFGSGLYSEDMTATVYWEMLSEAGAHLDLGQSVILDASWTLQCWRDAARSVAVQGVTEFVPIHCWVAPGVARARISRRADSGPQPSDATPLIYDEMSSALEPWSDAIDVDTSMGTEGSVAYAIGVMRITDPLT